MKVAADLVIRRGEEFLFIRRRNEPFKGMLAIRVAAEGIQGVRAVNDNIFISRAQY